jgi:hypothetical protein
MAPNKEDTVVPPGDCKASERMLDPADPFVKQVMEPVATIFVVSGTKTEKCHCEEQSDEAIPEAMRLIRSGRGETEPSQ